MITHLWQSTLFAALIAALTFVFAKNRAAVRHALWLTASIKFLLPFAALVAIGGAIGGRFVPPATVRHETLIILNDPNHPVPLPTFDVPAPPPQAAPLFGAWERLVPIAGAIWLSGVVIVLAVWLVRWRRMAMIARTAIPIESGPAFQSLRAIERRSGRVRPLKLVSSDARLEPGVFGILRPLLVWPGTIGDHLAPNQIVSILEHEVSHARRRDNLAAAIHKVVEALFWFHPLVWWIGARLVDERERACDEAVLQSGSEPEVYASSILAACRVYIEAPLPCVAGVTGSDLNRRIERIMTDEGGRSLSRRRKAALAGAAILVLAAPIAVGAASPRARVERSMVQTLALRVKRPLMLDVTPQGTRTLPQFEVASIKPNKSALPKVTIETSPGGRFTATNVTVRFLVQYAYGLQPSQMTGGPAWLTQDHFDVVANGANGEANAFEAEKLGAPSRTQLMVRALLADRFRLGVHTETREQPIFALVLANRDGHLGPQLKASTLDCNAATSAKYAEKDKGAPMKHVEKTPKSSGDAPPCGIRVGGGPGMMVVGGASLAQVAGSLTPWVGRLVVDRTGLIGNFDLTLKWTPDQIPQGFEKKIAAGAMARSDPNGPSIFTALKEQLGLKLDSQKGAVEMLVIERAEHPVEN